MSSFPAQAARVRDPGLPPRRRLLALRESVLHFCPYGFRATWHHLVVSAGIPVRLEEDPGSLVRAVDELEEAREIWLAEMRSFAARRVRQKAAGRRQPLRDEGWHALVNRLAFCPDPEVHPAERLAVVVRRLIEAPTADLTGEWSGSGQRPWPLIWHRAVRREATAGGGDFAQFRAEFTPTSPDNRFGIFLIYLRGVALGDATTTALYPHLQDLRHLADVARRPGARPPQPLVLGDTFDYLDLALEITETDLVFTFRTCPGYGTLPPWAAPAHRTMRLMVRRADVLNAWRDAEPEFARFLTEE